MSVELIKRTKQQELYLRWARLLWHDIMDGLAPNTKYAQREITRLLRRAKATRAEL